MKRLQTQHHETCRVKFVPSPLFYTSWNAGMKKKGAELPRSDIKLEGLRELSPSFCFFLFFGGEARAPVTQSKRCKGYETLVACSYHRQHHHNTFLKKISSSGFLYVQLCHSLKSSFQSYLFSTFFRGKNSGECVTLPQQIKLFNLHGNCICL